MSRVTVHSAGMISVDASKVKADPAAIEFLKSTHLYRQIVTAVGEPQAEQIVIGPAIVGPADANQGSYPAEQVKAG